MRSDGPRLLVLSNRGDTLDGAGGLVASLRPGARRDRPLWLAARPADPEPGPPDQAVRIPIEQYRAYYDVVANGSLWFCLHGMWDTPRRPRFDTAWRTAWAAYRDVNERFADQAAALAGPDATVLVHDYHLALVPALLGRRRPDVRTVAFMHVPWCSPSELSILPDDVAQALLEGLSAAEACGFHARRWEAAFRDCCQAVVGRAPRTFVSPAAPDGAALLATAGSPACRAELQALDELAGDRQLIVRVDRMDPSKNVLRGFWAYDQLLAERPDLRERVIFAAMVYPSRPHLAEYQSYGREVTTLVDHVNRRWATPGWQPVVLHTDDDHVRSVAALCRADVLLVNSLRDGLNLVAMEAGLVNERGGRLVLSRQAGSWDTVGEWAYGVNPYDISETAGALAAALATPAAEGARRIRGWRAAVEAHSGLDWWDDQLRAGAGWAVPHPGA